MPRRSNTLLSTHQAATEVLALLGQRIRAHRVAHGWTIKEMAERLLCSQNTYRAIEAGKPRASIGILANTLWLFGELDSLNMVAPLPYALSPGKRVRKQKNALATGRITEDERDF